MLLELFKYKRKYIMMGMVTALLLACLMLVALVLNSKTYYRGISVEGINVSGLNKLEAQERLNSTIYDFYINKNITLKYGEKEWELDLTDISYRISSSDVLEQAFNYGRKGNVFNRLAKIATVRFNNVNLEITPQYDSTRLQDILTEMKEQIDKKEKNAQVTIDKGNINLKKEEIGLSLDIDKNMKIIENNIKKKDFSPVHLHVANIFPPITLQSISTIDSILSSFSTKFNATNANRSYNLKIACERINNMVILPNTTFSMNVALGPRTTENGYREAQVIYKNELVNGTGGGVCQVTSTLYNAVLRSKLQVVERTNHSIPLGYVQPGQDATIAENYIDFKFKNNRDNAICINAEVIDSKVVVRLYGKHEKSEYDVKIVSDVIKEYHPEEEEVLVDNEVLPGERVVVREPVIGRKVVVYRETYSKDGELVDREKISEDVYKPVRGIVKVHPSYFMTPETLY